MASKVLPDFSNYSNEEFSSFELDTEHTNNPEALSHIDNFGTIIVDSYGREIIKRRNVLDDLKKYQKSRNILDKNKKSHVSQSVLEPIITSHKEHRSPTNKNPCSSNREVLYKVNCVRPNYSYTQLITMAIESSDEKAMSINDIYKYCEDRFPYYAQTENGWKNSLRHYLSINNCFKKIKKTDFSGRGSLWILDPILKEKSSVKNSPNTKANLRRKYNDSNVEEEKCVVIVEKLRHMWTDTRLDSGLEKEFIYECDSSTSNTDYNDWQRSILYGESVFAIKSHWENDCLITPIPNKDHNYCMPSVREIRNNPSLSVRHNVVSPINRSNPPYSSSNLNENEMQPLATNDFQFGYPLSYITVDVGESARSFDEEIGSPCSDDAITKFREEHT